MKVGGGGDPKEKIGSANEKLKGARIQSHAGGPFQQRESLSAGSRRDVFLGFLAERSNAVSFWLSLV